MSDFNITEQPSGDLRQQSGDHTPSKHATSGPRAEHLSDSIRKCEELLDRLKKEWVETHTNWSSKIKSVQEAENILKSFPPGSSKHTEAITILLGYATWVVGQFGPLDQPPPYEVEFREGSRKVIYEPEEEEADLLRPRLRAMWEILDFVDTKARKIMGIEPSSGHQFTDEELFKWEIPIEQQMVKEMTDFEDTESEDTPSDAETPNC
jgi:hypothetical protein